MSQVSPGPVRQKRAKMVRSKEHIDYVKRHSCVVCMKGELIRLNDRRSQATHINFLGAKHGKPRGMAERVDDFWTVPQCNGCHDWQSHDGQSGAPEKAWWAARAIDVERICLELARNSPDPVIRAAVKELENNS